MIRLLFCLLFVCFVSGAGAQTIGQYELRKRTSTGFTAYGITLSNGQVIGLTAGVPAAITPFTSADAAAGYQPLSSTLTTLSSATAAGLALMDDANASAQRTTLGLGTAATLATSAGGNGVADSGLVPVYDGTGNLTASVQINVIDGTNTGTYGAANLAYLQSGGDLTVSPPTLSGSVALTWPGASGTLIGTGNLTAITATGTITSGTWQGGIIAPAYLGTGTSITTKYLRGDGTWQTISSGLTVGTSTITSGTDGYILYNNAGTLGNLATTGSGSVVRATSPTLVTPTLGVASATDVSTSGRFYGASGVAYPQFTTTGASGYGMRVASDRIDYWLAGSVVITFVNGGIGLAMDMGGTAVAWGSNVALWGGSDGGGRLVQRVGSSPQAYSIANTYSSYSNKEEVELGWTSNVAHLWTVKGSGGGTARDLVLGFDSTEKMRLGTNTTNHAQPVKLKSYIVSGLPSASTCGAGSCAFVTDATATTAYTTVAGGGSNQVLVISDGTNWIIH